MGRHQKRVVFWRKSLPAGNAGKTGRCNRRKSTAGIYSGQEVRLHDEVDAERLVCESFARLRLKESDLPLLPKGTDEKKAVITLIKKRTHVSNKWIVKRLYAGHPANITRYLADVKAAKPGSRLSELVKMLKCED